MHPIIAISSHLLINNLNLNIWWYLGFARHQGNIKYPDTSLLNITLDAVDREPPDDPPNVEIEIINQ